MKTGDSLKASLAGTDESVGGLHTIPKTFPRTLHGTERRGAVSAQQQLRRKLDANGRDRLQLVPNNNPRKTNRGASPTDADGAQAGGSGIVVIKYKTDAGSVEGFFIN